MPNVNSNLVIKSKDLSNNFFSSSIDLSNENTLYYVRSYAKNGSGISYGKQLSIKTKRSLPVVSNKGIVGLTSYNVNINGSVDDIGGSIVTELGICISDNPNVTKENSVVYFIDPTKVKNDFSLIVNKLQPDKKYFFNVYAINSYGVAYGKEESFTTPVLTNQNLLGVQYLNNSVAYAYGEKVLLKSLDGGNSWFKIRELDSHSIASVEFYNSALGYMGTYSGGYGYLYKTIDGGITWTQLGEYWSSGSLMLLKDIEIANENSFYVLLRFNSYSTRISQILKSEDGGKSIKWESTKPIGNCLLLYSGGLFMGGEYYWDFNSYINSVFFKDLSTSENSIIPLNENSPILKLSSKDNYVIGPSSDGKIVLSSNYGKSFTFIGINGYSNTKFNDAIVINSQLAYLVGNNGILLKSTNFSTWEKVNLGTTKNLNSIKLKPNGKLLIVGDGGLIINDF